MIVVASAVLSVDPLIMKAIVVILCVYQIIQNVVGPPVTQKQNDGKVDGNEINETDHLEPLGIEYSRYLKEVVTALESDPEFRHKLEKAEEADIRTGKIAQELEYVNHQVRTKLDELKRQELERLRHLAIKEYELRNGIDTEHLKIPPEHLDHSNPHTFEIEDLRKLIAKTTADLAEADKKRRQEFKEYEMQKEFEKQEKLRTLDEEHKQQLQKELEEKEKKLKVHEPLHHPGSKQQLEEVWQKQDHMENQEFDPKTFFYLHDLDGNGVWDEQEVKALFLKELDKLYKSGAPEADMRERVEEMERMREHVFAETDTNKDGLISYAEFLAQTMKPDFEKDQGWESLDEQQVFTQEEYREFERQRQETIKKMVDQGLIPPYPNGMPPSHGSHQPIHHSQQIPPYPNGMPPPPGNHQPVHHPQQIPPYPSGMPPPSGSHQPVHHPQQFAPPQQQHQQQQQQPQQQQQQQHQQQQHHHQQQQQQQHHHQQQQQQFHPQEQVPPGYMPQGQMPHGQFAKSYAPQRHYTPSKLPQGQVMQGHLPQGYVPPGTYQYDHIIHSQVNTGQIPLEQPSNQILQGSPVQQGEGQQQPAQTNLNPSSFNQQENENSLNEIMSNGAEIAKVVNNKNAADAGQIKEPVENLKEASMNAIPPVPVIHPRQPSRTETKQ